MLQKGVILTWILFLRETIYYLQFYYFLLQESLFKGREFNAQEPSRMQKVSKIE